MIANKINRLLAVLNLILIGMVGALIFVNPYNLIATSIQSAPEPDKNWFGASLPQRRPYSEYGKKITSRRLFESGLQVEAPVVQRSIIDDYKFLGSSRSPNGPRAFLRNTIDGQSRMLGIGDSLGDYIVESINSNGIQLKRDDKIVLLRR